MIIKFHNNTGLKVVFIESYETNPQLSRLSFYLRLWEMNILLGSRGISGEDLLKRQTLLLRAESIILQYGLPPNLETNHIQSTQKHLL